MKQTQVWTGRVRVRPNQSERERIRRRRTVSAVWRQWRACCRRKYKLIGVLIEMFASGVLHHRDRRSRRRSRRRRRRRRESAAHIASVARTRHLWFMCNVIYTRYYNHIAMHVARVWCRAIVREHMFLMWNGVRVFELNFTQSYAKSWQVSVRAFLYVFLPVQYRTMWL